MTISSLLEIIRKMDDLHRELIVHAKSKTPVLVENRIDELNAIVSKENKIIRQISELDRARIQATGEYLISRGYNPDPRVTVSDLIRIIFTAQDKKALMDAHSSLLETINELRKLNEANQKLIEQSLAFINYSLDVVLGPADDEAVYHNPSQNRNANRSGLFDTRA